MNTERLTYDKVECVYSLGDGKWRIEFQNGSKHVTTNHLVLGVAGGDFIGFDGHGRMWSKL